MMSNNQGFLTPPATPPLNEAEADETGFLTPPRQMIFTRTQPPPLVRHRLNFEPEQRGPGVDENIIRARRRRHLLTEILQVRLIDNLTVDNGVATAAATTTNPGPLDNSIEATILARRKRMKPCSDEVFVIKRFNDDDQPPPNNPLNFRLGI